MSINKSFCAALSGAMLAATLTLSACGSGGGGGNSGQYPSTPHGGQTVAGAIIAVEASGASPLLDRSNSIAGTDTDADGVRDDIEAYIDSLTGTAAQKGALRQASEAISDAMVVAASAVDETALREASTDISNAVHCIWITYSQGVANNKVADIRKLTVNTRERFEAYAEYNNLVSGFALRLPKGDTCDEAQRPTKYIHLKT